MKYECVKCWLSHNTIADDIHVCRFEDTINACTYAPNKCPRGIPEPDWHPFYTPKEEMLETWKVFVDYCGGHEDIAKTLATHDVYKHDWTESTSQAFERYKEAEAKYNKSKDWK